MLDFAAVALSPVAVNKFFHTVLSSWILGAVFVIGVSSWYLLKKRNTDFSRRSIRVAALFGLTASILTLWTGDGSAYQVAQRQPMKLAAMEGLYDGTTHAELVAIGVLDPAKTQYNDGKDPYLFHIAIPDMLSLLAERNADAFVPGIRDLIDGGYRLKDGSTALSAEEKMERGRVAIQALANYRAAMKENDTEEMALQRAILDDNFAYFGYGYIQEPTDLIPPVGLTFYAFHIMVALGGFFILLFILTFMLEKRGKLADARWMHYICLFSIPLAYIASQAGWIVAEVGRQPWAIQDILPTSASISRLDASSVQLTFFIFLVLFTVLLIAELSIMLKAIRRGPDNLITND